MKIINLETLLKQNPGVVFADYEGCGEVGGLKVFGGATGPIPGYYLAAEFSADYPHLPEGQRSWANFYRREMESGVEARINVDCWGRDGTGNDDDMQFVLLDREDVLALQLRLTKSLAEAYDVTLTSLHHPTLFEVPEGEKEVVIPIESLITVAQLKAIVNSLPNKDNDGEDFHVHLAEGTISRHSLLPGELILEKTSRQLANGSFGVELTICAS